MKQFSVYLFVLFACLASLNSSAQIGTSNSITLQYTSGAQSCDYIVSVTAEVSNSSTGATYMTSYQTVTMVEGTSQTVTFPVLSGYSLTGRFIFNVTPNGSGCSFVIDYINNPPASATTLYACNCLGATSGVLPSYWTRLATRAFKFGLV
jgi:hypothetical protein